jgi:hypothetical protein
MMMCVRFYSVYYSTGTVFCFDSVGHVRRSRKNHHPGMTVLSFMYVFMTEIRDSQSQNPNKSSFGTATGGLVLAKLPRSTGRPGFLPPESSI